MVILDIMRGMILIFFCSTKKNEGQGLWKCTGKIAKSNSCKKCLKKRENEVRKNRRLRRALKMKIDDFIDLGKTYFWFLDIIDPFTGM